MTRYDLKLRNMFYFARSLAGLSCCKRTQVGCIIFPIECTNVISIGYNGPPAGINNESCTNEQHQCGCIHAEANALVKARPTDEYNVLFSTRAPCYHCAGLIINTNKIVDVYYDNDYSDDRGIKLLEDSNIIVRKTKF